MGAAYIVKKLNHFAEFVGGNTAGFFKPCSYLTECAAQNRKLGAGKSPSSKM